MLAGKRRARQDLSKRLMERLNKEAKRLKEGERDVRAKLIQVAQN